MTSHSSAVDGASGGSSRSEGVVAASRGVRELLGMVGPGLVVAVVLAMIGLTNRDAWMDEACSIAATVQPRVIFDRTAGTMAGYYAVLYGWIRVSDSLWWIRFLSVLFAAAAVVITGWVALRLRGAAVARWACILLGASYMLVYYAREARSFAMVMVVLGASWLALDKVVAGGEHRNAWTLVHLGLAALVPLTHGLAMIGLLSQTIALLASRVSVRTWARVVPGYVASLAVVWYLLSLGASDVGAGNGFTVDGAWNILLLLHGGERWSGISFDPRPLLLAATVYGVVLATGRWWRATDPLDRFRSIVPAVWAVATIVGFFVLNLRRENMIARYVIGVMPALAILQADAAFHLQGAIAAVLRVPRRWTAIPVVAAVLVLASVPSQLRLDERRDRTWSDMVEIVAAEGRDGDGFFSPRASGRMTFDYAWSQHGGRLPVLESVGPVHDVGVVQRFGSRISLERSIELMSDLDRVWVLEVPLSGKDPAFGEAAIAVAITGRFESVGSYRFRYGVLHLVERT